jgi:hypothetical protein
MTAELSIGLTFHAFDAPEPVVAFDRENTELLRTKLIIAWVP